VSQPAVLQAHRVELGLVKTMGDLRKLPLSGLVAVRGS